VLFDFIAEQNFSAATLKRFRVVILPEVRYLSEERVRALRDYVSSGGIVVMIGNCAGFDEEGRQRSQDPFASGAPAKKMQGKVRVFSIGKGFLAEVASLDVLVPRRAFEIFDLSEEESNDIEVVMKGAKSARAQKRAPSPLLALLRSLSKTDFAAADRRVSPTVRVSAFAKDGKAESLLVVHVVNYGVPIHGIGNSGPPVVARNVRFSLPLPAGWRVSSVRALEPGGPEQRVEFSQKAGRVAVTLPELSIYKVLAVRCRRRG
jgi:hypothetical protein